MYSALSRRFVRARTGLELQVLAAMHMQSFARGWLTRQRAKMASAAKIVQRRFRQDAKFRASPEGRAAKKKRRRPPAPYRAAITIQRRARAMLWARQQAALAPKPTPGPGPSSARSPSPSPSP